MFISLPQCGFLGYFGTLGMMGISHVEEMTHRMQGLSSIESASIMTLSVATLFGCLVAGCKLIKVIEQKRKNTSYSIRGE